MKQTPNNNKATMNNKATAKQTKKQRKAEAEEGRGRCSQKNQQALGTC